MTLFNEFRNIDDDGNESEASMMAAGGRFVRIVRMGQTFLIA